MRSVNSERRLGILDKGVWIITASSANCDLGQDGRRDEAKLARSLAFELCLQEIRQVRDAMNDLANRECMEIVDAEQTRRKMRIDFLQVCLGVSRLCGAPPL